MTSRETAWTDLGDAMPLSSAYLDGFFRPFIGRGGVLALVRAILADEERLAWCAANGYQHHNDFTKVVLGVSPAGRKLVWHEWRQRRPWVDGDYHNHRWDFVSYIAGGELELTDFEEDPDGPLEVDRYRYESPGGQTEYALRRVGSARLREARRVKVAAGEFYFQPHEIVHNAASKSQGTSTFIIQGEVAATSTDVYLAGAGEERLERAAPRFSPAELRPPLERLRDGMEEVSRGTSPGRW
ncbi:hypothetical protein [Actinomadura sp. DC4]|uniref:hypothetical protein n=1 Tax=Actinomadura sp. DC4 TaxID=3055069 RepID=UPI0025AFD15D|nr:hypothetical protein [Actinomadura sp. DC4]MDN3355790.1 hypothetical protein [Actinomadura sp. DC4]